MIMRAIVPLAATTISLNSLALMKKLLNSLPGRLVCGAVVLFMVVGLFTEPWDKRGPRHRVCRAHGFAGFGGDSAMRHLTRPQLRIPAQPTLIGETMQLVLGVPSHLPDAAHCVIGSDGQPGCAGTDAPATHLVEPGGN